MEIGNIVTQENYTEAALWAQDHNATLVQLDENTYVLQELPTNPLPTYAEKRAAEYPLICEQLDMIYWDKINGTSNWVNKIGEIKAKYPKE